MAGLEIHCTPDGKGGYRSVDLITAGQLVPVEIDGAVVGDVSAANLMP